MSKRYQGGILGVGFNPLQAPNAPTDVTATGGDASASVAFTAPTNVGGSAITGYTVQSDPGAIAATGSSSPITVTGLSNGTAYTFNVWALNSYGPSPAGGPSGSVTPATPRGLFAGGYINASPFSTSSISYITISTTGNATDFGDLTANYNSLSACSSNTRGVFYVGGTGGNTLEYVTIATTGNATYFGDLVGLGSQGVAGGCSNQTRGFFAGSYATASQWNVITYITIATTGNSSAFGELTQQRGYIAALTNTTRAVFGGGAYVISATAYFVNVMDYVTIATTGNATDFGDMTQATYQYTACSSATRGVFAGGQASGANTNVISYITTATTGNATDFGDLSEAKRNLAGCSSPTRGVFGGGTTTSAINVIEYITIATTGNATDFGDLLVAATSLGACSNVHGGL